MRRLGATYSVLIAFVLAGALVLRYWDPAPVERARAIAFDTYQRLSPRIYDPRLPVRIVDIDEPSLKARGQWPWPRTEIAEMIKRLDDMGAAAVVFDMVFPEPDRLSPEQLVKRMPADPALAETLARLADHKPNDQVLGEAIAKSNVVMGFVGLSGGDALQPPPLKAEIEYQGDAPSLFVPAYSSAVANLPVISAHSAGSGAINWIADFDQVVRKLPLIVRIGDRLYPSITAEALRVAQSIANFRIISSGADGERSFGTRTGISEILIGRAAVPTDAEGQMWLHFTRSEPTRYLSALNLFNGTASEGSIKGHIVLIGTSAAGLLDIRATPLDPSIPGVEIHAQAIEQILSGHYLSRPDYATGSEVIFIIMAGLLLAIAVHKTGAAAGAVVGGLAVLCVFGGAWIGFIRLGWLLDPTFPTLSLSGLYLVGTSYLRLATEHERNAGREKLRRIAQEMESAAQIQRSFLPHEELKGQRSECFDIFAKMIPAKDVGGDFYDYFFVDDDRLGFVIGDVSGKGVPAALFMSVSRTVLRTIAFEGEAPGRVLTRVNEILSRDNTQCMFVTVFYALLDLKTGEVSFASAGHDDTLLIRNSGEQETLEVMGPAIGLIDIATYRTETRSLSTGDMLVLLTDGITEAFDVDGKAYGVARLMNAVRMRDFTRSGDLVSSLVDDVSRFSRGAEQSDDITCVAMRYLGQGERPSPIPDELPRVSDPRLT